MNKTYTIPAIHCQHCVHTVKMELEGIEGVEKVDVNLDTKKASVTFNPPEVEQTVLKTLAEIGYPAEQ